LDQAVICFNTGTPDTSGLNLPDTDIIGSTRIWGSAIDRGAYELMLENYDKLTETKDDFVFYPVFPNPVDDVLIINIYSSEIQSIKINICDLSGKIVFSNKFDIQSIGMNQINIRLNSIRSSSGRAGIYFCTVLAGNQSQTRKFIAK